MPEFPTCRRCLRRVSSSVEDWETLERMHWVCFHYEFEHDPVDPDDPCGAAGCPSGILPPTRPSDLAVRTLHEVVDAIRAPYAEAGWVLDMDRPGVLRLRRADEVVLLVAVDEVGDR